jgi:hypothetical protein
MPILAKDKEISIQNAMKQIPDSRVSYFWDGEAELANDYSRVLQLPDGQNAWDIYMVFNQDAEWRGGDPPSPHYWMHQLGGLSEEHELDGARLAAETTKLLGAGGR